MCKSMNFGRSCWTLTASILGTPLFSVGPKNPFLYPLSSGLAPLPVLTLLTLRANFLSNIGVFPQVWYHYQL